ncbi:hypothetical protein BH10ACI3_BH10ACI3_00370 [soil metagenome]
MWHVPHMQHRTTQHDTIGRDNFTANYKKEQYAENYRALLVPILMAC